MGNHTACCMGPSWSLKYFLPVQAPYNVWLKLNNFQTQASFNILARRQSSAIWARTGHIRARRCMVPIRLLLVPYGFQNPYKSRMGSFDFLAHRCSETCMASAWAHITYLQCTCTCPLWKYRGHVRALYGSTGDMYVPFIEVQGTCTCYWDPMIKAHREPVESLYACDHAHRRWMISYGIPKGHRPVWLPKSYGPGIIHRFHVTKA